MTQKSASAQCMSLLYTGHPILDECVFNSDACVDRSFSQSCTLCCFHTKKISYEILLILWNGT